MIILTEAVPDHLPTDTRVYVADNCGLHVQAQAQRSNKASDYGWVRDQRPLKFHEYEEEDLESGASQDWLPELEVRRCTGVAVPLRVVPSPTGLPSNPSSPDSYLLEPTERPKESQASCAPRRVSGT